MSNDVISTDLARFGWREREMARDLLSAWLKDGVPSGFYEEEVQIMANFYSGNVFLTNSDFQVAMLYNGKLEEFYNSPYEGLEGFYDELAERVDEMHPEDKEWFESLKK